MARVRPGGAERWKRRASAATQDFKTGIENPRSDWAQQTANAKESWAEGVRQSISNGLFEKGVKKAGSAKWRERSLNKGVNRYSEGVLMSENAYTEGVAPYLQTIESTTLPPKYPKGDTRNIERVKAMNNALRARKVKGG